MELPKMRQSSMSRQTVEVFGGYDHNLQISEGSFYEMENMTSDYYPVLSPRDPRGKTGFGRAQALVSSHGLCRVEDGRFYLPDGMDVGVSLSAGEKQLVTMGAYVIILPDKVWVNVAETEEKNRWGAIEQCYRKETGSFVLQPCKADGTVYKSISETKPESPGDGQMWLDVSGEYPVLKQWEETTGVWVSVETGYVRVQMNGIGELFEKGDSVTVKMDGFRYENKNALRHIGELEEMIDGAGTQGWGCLRANWVIREKEKDFIVIHGYLGVSTCTGAVGNGNNVCVGEVVVEQKLPDMDLVVESGNRLWGCKYGTGEKGFVNEIYASKLGDFKNFYCYQGISTDSYTASVGADGPFTGAVSYQGRPVFFKENCMIEVFGNYPGEYRLQCTPCDGVGQGCEKSLAMVSNVLYYKSPLGVCAYDGSLPVQIGKALGDSRYTNAVAGVSGRKYYISMYDGAAYHLFAYDTDRRLWHREDDLQVFSFCSSGSTLYANTEKGILALDGSGQREDQQVKWMVQTGKLGMRLPESKYVSRLTLRLSMELGAELAVYACYDSEGVWEHLYTVRNSRLGSLSVPIRPRRCDHIQLRLEGLGDGKLYSLTKTIEKGSEAF